MCDYGVVCVMCMNMVVHTLVHGCEGLEIIPSDLSLLGSRVCSRPHPVCYVDTGIRMPVPVLGLERKSS